jgi:putative protease
MPFSFYLCAMKSDKIRKPELLLPAGNTEAFFAAIEGGADAIYLGLHQFNARNRASNFTPWQIAAMIKIARSKGVKIYITLNTIIRNFEIGKLLDTLFLIGQLKPDAVIIQDIGVQHIMRKYFPQVALHASTQMAIHNSAGVGYAAETGIERIVLARELTRNEIEQISRKSPTELELFVHGALCYSFSGMCLFSSYLGGASANRGMCTQPCRRIYRQNQQGKYHFSLKDNQLIDFLPELSALNISSIKIEGRMKPADYVFRVAKAYRMALDNPEKIDEAKKIIENDLGREKTSYFFGKDVRLSVTQSASAGQFIGKVGKVEGNIVQFKTDHVLETGSRLRFRNPHNDKQFDLKIEQFTIGDNAYHLTVPPGNIKQGDEVYLTGNRLKVAAKLSTDGIRLQERLSAEKAKAIINTLKSKNIKGEQETFIRIDSLKWIQFLPLTRLKGIIVALPLNEWNTVSRNMANINAIREKVFFELPKFIPESKLQSVVQACNTFCQNGYKSFFVSHISQKKLLPSSSIFSTNENVYLFNDAAIQFARKENAKYYTYPFENDIANLAKGNDRMGIVPLYFLPHLFFSRMPVSLASNEPFSDSNGNRYVKTIRNGMTIILPEHPVSLTQFREKLDRYGFFRFMIDLSHITPDEQRFKEIWKSYNQSEALKPSTMFNFKRELK